MNKLITISRETVNKLKKQAVMHEFPSVKNYMEYILSEQANREKETHVYFMGEKIILKSAPKKSKSR